MIRLVTARGFEFTHYSLHRERGLDLDVTCYEDVLSRKSPYRATHVFTDLDRLPDWQLHEASRLYRKLRAAGIRVLNDPARFLGRFGMLRALNRAGINGFDAYRVDGLERPRRWPVFLRLEGDHWAPVSGLIHGEDELDEAIRKAVGEGAPQSSLLIIEYAAEPVASGLYRKLSVFRIGARFLGYTCVHDDNWLVKYGKIGIATPEMYDEEYRFVRDNPFEAAVRPAFELAGIDYGRVDFGLVDGKPQIYEINSNPYVSLRASPGASPRRKESAALFRTNYLDAMNEIDSFERPALVRRPASLVRTARRASSRAFRKFRERLPGTNRSAEPA